MANFICKVFDQLTGKLVVSVQKQFTTQQDARESLPQIVTEIKGKVLNFSGYKVHFFQHIISVDRNTFVKQQDFVDYFCNIIDSLINQCKESTKK